MSNASGCGTSSSRSTTISSSVTTSRVALRDVARILEGNPRAVLFEHTAAPKVRARRQRARQPRAHGARVRRRAPEGLLADVLRRLRRKPEVRRARASDQAPVHEVILTGARRRRDQACRSICSTAATADRTSRRRSTSAIDPATETDQRRVAAPDAARAPRDRHRPRCGERSAQHLPRGRRARRTSCRSASSSAAIRSITFAATMRIPGDEIGLISRAARRPAANRQERHERHPRAGRRRVRDRRLSRRRGLHRERRSVRRVSRATTAA